MYSLPSLSTALSCLRLIQLKLVFQVQIKGCTKKTLFFKKKKEETRRCTTVRDSEGQATPCNGGSDESVWVMEKWSMQCVSGCHEVSENIWFEYCRRS